MTGADRIAATAATADLGRPSARKTGRRPDWPYVPVIAFDRHERQILRRAFVTRDEAVAFAAWHIEESRARLAQRLAQPRHRALREYYGLPRGIEELAQ